MLIFFSLHFCWRLSFFNCKYTLSLILLWKHFCNTEFPIDLVGFKLPLFLVGFKLLYLFFDSFHFYFPNGCQKFFPDIEQSALIQLQHYAVYLFKYLFSFSKAFIYHSSSSIINFITEYILMSLGFGSSSFCSWFHNECSSPPRAPRPPLPYQTRSHIHAFMFTFSYVE